MLKCLIFFSYLSQGNIAQSLCIIPLFSTFHVLDVKPLDYLLQTVSRLIDESESSLVGPSSSNDIEAGKWEEQSNLRLRPVFQDRIRSGRKHLGSIVRQLDAIFSAGVVFLRRNPAAQLGSLVYLVCLHFWVMYILMSHSQASDDTSSGAVISLETINKTSGA